MRGANLQRLIRLNRNNLALRLTLTANTAIHCNKMYLLRRTQVPDVQNRERPVISCRLCLVRRGRDSQGSDDSQWLPLNPSLRPCGSAQRRNVAGTRAAPEVNTGPVPPRTTQCVLCPEQRATDGWGRVARMKDNRNAYIILVGKPEGN